MAVLATLPAMRDSPEPGVAPVVFIGGGNMASALIGGLLKAGRSAAAVRVVEPFEAQRDKLAQQFGVSAAGLPPTPAGRRRRWWSGR